MPDPNPYELHETISTQARHAKEDQTDIANALINKVTGIVGHAEVNILERFTAVEARMAAMEADIAELKALLSARMHEIGG